MQLFRITVAATLAFWASSLSADVVLSLAANEVGDIEMFALSNGGDVNVGAINLHLTSSDCTIESWTPEGPLGASNFLTQQFTSGMAVSGGTLNVAGAEPVGSARVKIATIDVTPDIVGTVFCNISFNNAGVPTDLGALGVPIIAPDSTVTAVPEPSPLIVLGLLACLMSGRTWWIRHQSQQTTNS